ncbi:CPSF A subunit region-domain-containing protein [Naematelia encephala]|uniref:CPSF A subunit region-domain-containing protein n=1 Tax=Naematelia encephala TaxID=71784 RepID=A0A1Y2BIU5_9TREE|nr:CPSF A subunit region-domain-containing protein [Naematelia encephala]
MLYIGSALSPTPVLDSRLIPSFTSPGSQSLVIAKPDRIEVWDADRSGLVKKAELELWGNVVAIEKVEVKDARPHILVLQAPPNAHLLLVTYTSTPTPSLIVTSSLPLTPPTPSLRQAEFFVGVISQDHVALVSLWVGVLSRIGMEVEKDKEAKKRRASIAHNGVEDDSKVLVFTDNFNINIREHNLLNLAFMPQSAGSEPMLTFLWLSSTSSLLFQPRRLSLATHSFTDVTKAVDVVTLKSSVEVNGETDFSRIPFSCPAARRILPIPSDGPNGEKLALVIGDEYSTLYAISSAPQSPKVSRGSLSSSAGGAMTSPRAAAKGRSPQTEVSGAPGKRRKSSMNMTPRRSSTDSSERWDARPVWRVRQGYGTVLAATVLEVRSSGATILLGDEAGRLIALSWDYHKDENGLLRSTGVQKIEYGEASPASSLTYLASSHIFLSSACGDSALVRLDASAPPEASPEPPTRSAVRAIPGLKGKGKARDGKDEESGPWSVLHEDDLQGNNRTLERWLNLAPVKDFCTVTDESGGVSHLVVSSGASNANSLRIVRSGVGLEEVISIEGLEDVTGLWAINLLLSTTTTTSILHLDPEISVAAVSPAIASTLTLAAGLVPDGDILVQVTPRNVSLWADLQAGTRIDAADVTEQEEIVAAQVSGSLVAIAKRGGHVQALSASLQGLQDIGTLQVGSEISAVSIIPFPGLSPIIAVATWTNEIHLYRADGASPSLTLSENFAASSLQLIPGQPDAMPTVSLLAGLSDGTLLTLHIALDSTISLIGRKASSLGTLPLKLCEIPKANVVTEIDMEAGNKGENEEQLVSIGLSDRMSVIFETNDRIDFSSVSRKDVVAAVTVNTSSLGNCLALATETGLSFVRINSLKKLQVQTLDLQHRSVEKIVNCPDFRVIAAGSITRTMDPQTGDVKQVSHFELRDPTNLILLAEQKMQEREEVTCVQPVFLNGRHYIAVGTAIFPSDDDFDEAVYVGSSAMVNSREGRVLLIEPKLRADEEWDVRALATIKTVGPVHDIEVIHGFLVIAAASKVTLYRLDPIPTRFTELSSMSSAFIARHLHVAPKSKLYPEDRLVVGDGMRSIFVLDVDEANGMFLGDQRDLATHCVTALEGISGDGVIIADGYTNLITLRLKEEIETAAHFGLHEDVARFRPGSLVPPSSAGEVIIPELIFATTDGRLGVIGELSPTAASTLDDLQRNMDKFYKGPGGISWKARRRGGTELTKRDTAGFIDGDFVQKFRDASLLSPEETDKILTGSNPHEHISVLSAIGKKAPATRGDVVRLLETVGGVH